MMNFLAPINHLFLELLVQLHQLTGNLGWSIIAFTALIRLVLVPLSIPTARSQKKIKELAPEYSALKKLHKGDKKALQSAQMELYKKHNVNPLAGCLPQLVQIALLIFLYQILVSFVGQTEVNGVVINTKFFWLNLSKPDQFYVLPVLAAITQLIMSVMILPGGETPDVIPNQSKDKSLVKENEKEEDAAEMAASMQKNMLFLMPIMTGMFAMRFPSGVALYWVASTVFSIGQQYFTSGWGGVETYSRRIYEILIKREK